MMMHQKQEIHLCAVLCYTSSRWQILKCSLIWICSRNPKTPKGRKPPSCRWILFQASGWAVYMSFRTLATAKRVNLTYIILCHACVVTNHHFHPRQKRPNTFIHHCPNSNNAGWDPLSWDTHVAMIRSQCLFIRLRTRHEILMRTVLHRSISTQHCQHGAVKTHLLLKRSALWKIIGSSHQATTVFSQGGTELVHFIWLYGHGFDNINSSVSKSMVGSSWQQ